jgi:hypothetical protein
MKTIDNDTFEAYLSELINQYEVGLYTKSELVSVVLNLLFDGSTTEKNWCNLPEWIQKRVLKMVIECSESEEIITFGPIKPEVLKRQNEILKAWLIEKGYLQIPITKKENQYG